MRCAQKPVCDILEDGLRAAMTPRHGCAQVRLMAYVEVLPPDDEPDAPNLVREIFLILSVHRRTCSLQVSNPVTYADFVMIPTIFTTYPYHGKTEDVANVDEAIRRVRGIPNIESVLNMREDVLTCTTTFSFDD